MRENTVMAVAKKFKLSNRDSATLAVLATLPALLNGNLAPAHIRALVYRHGAEACRAAIYLNGGRISEALTLLASWKIPVFPLKGDDVVRLGVSAGPKIGETLRAVEEWWIKGDFKADRGVCLKEASKHK
jgi:poly(A) polymerase